MRNERPDVFAYADYRAYLRDLYVHGRAAGAGMSLRAFSRRARLRSPNYLKRVMDGDRNLTSETAQRFAGACGLAGESADYFCDLVAFNQAQNSAERSRFHARLRSYRRYRAVRVLDVARSAYYANWYIPAIRELVSRVDFREDPSWIARTLIPSISASQARKALRVLEELGLVVRDEGGALTQGEGLLSTGEGPQPHQVAEYHRSMMDLAQRAIDEVPRPLRDISSLTLCVSEDQVQALKDRIRAFREELLQTTADASDPTRVVQLCVQLFPLSQGETT